MKAVCSWAWDDSSQKKPKREEDCAMSANFKIAALLTGLETQQKKRCSFSYLSCCILSCSYSTAASSARLVSSPGCTCHRYCWFKRWLWRARWCVYHQRYQKPLECHGRKEQYSGGVIKYALDKLQVASSFSIQCMEKHHPVESTNSQDVQLLRKPPARAQNRTAAFQKAVEVYSTTVRSTTQL